MDRRAFLTQASAALLVGPALLSRQAVAAFPPHIRSNLVRPDSSPDVKFWFHDLKPGQWARLEQGCPAPEGTISRFPDYWIGEDAALHALTARDRVPKYFLVPSFELAALGPYSEDFLQQQVEEQWFARVRLLTHAGCAHITVWYWTRPTCLMVPLNPPGLLDPVVASGCVPFTPLPHKGLTQRVAFTELAMCGWKV